jgi:hypothetical protein
MALCAKSGHVDRARPRPLRRQHGHRAGWSESEHENTFVGNVADTRYFGNAGNDSFTGAGGNDSLRGGGPIFDGAVTCPRRCLQAFGPFNCAHACRLVARRKRRMCFL